MPFWLGRGALADTRCDPPRTPPTQPPQVIVLFGPGLSLISSAEKEGTSMSENRSRGLGTGLKELRESFSTGEDADTGASESGKVRSEKPHDGSGDGTVQTVGAHASQSGL